MISFSRAPLNTALLLHVMSGSAVRIEEGAVVCDGAVLEGGDITIGPGTVVFPGALIRCSEGAGPVVIGRGCVLEESSVVECVDAGGLLVGEGNLFEVGCTVRALAVSPSDRCTAVQSCVFLGRDWIMLQSQLHLFKCTTVHRALDSPTQPWDNGNSAATDMVLWYYTLPPCVVIFSCRHAPTRAFCSTG